jgi:hypothetical protein
MGQTATTYVSLMLLSSGSFSGGNMTVPWSGTGGGDPIVSSIVTALAVELAAKAQNTAATAYSVSLSGLNLETGLSDGTDPLGLLYTALGGKYVNLDLSGCTGTNTQSTTTTYTEVQNRVNTDRIVSVVLPNTLTTLGDFAFYSCDSLVSITLPDSLNIIGSHAFADCGLLTTITLPSTLQTIGSFAFNGCASLTSLNIPASVTSIESWAFFGSTSLVFNVASGNTTYSTLDSGKMLIKGGNELVSYPSATGSITIPSEITKLSFGGVFRSCTTLTSVEFLAVTIDEIDYGVFWDCTALATVVLRNATTPPVTTDPFDMTTARPNIYVPDTSVSAYQTAEGWSEHAAKITGISTWGTQG